MTPVLDRRHRDQWLIFWAEFGSLAVEINKTTASIRISRNAPAHMHLN